jgi:hypothetical protein
VSRLDRLARSTRDLLNTLAAIADKKAGSVERGGSMRAHIMQDGSARSHGDFIKKNISPTDPRLMTDGAKHYRKVAAGYDRQFVEHTKGEYVRGDVHVNNIETFWAHVKRSIKGTHKGVSKKHMQSYLDGFVFLYNQRRDTDYERFSALLDVLLRSARRGSNARRLH